MLTETQLMRVWFVADLRTYWRPNTRTCVGERFFFSQKFDSSHPAVL